MTNDDYLLENADAEAGERFDALAALFDPWTRRHLLALGLGNGWHCWEVGAGGVSVPAWLAEQVGTSGRVVATDIDTSWIAGVEGFEVLQHDLRTDPPPGPFDLIHARLVLVHMTSRDEAIGDLVQALRPGGWLVLEDADPALQPLLCPDEYGPAQLLGNRLRAGFRSLLAARGADLAFGRTLPRRLRGSGLVDVGADAYFPITGSACEALEQATVRQIGGRLIEAGLATAEEIAQHLSNIADGGMDLATAPLITAWGRRVSDG